MLQAVAALVIAYGLAMVIAGLFVADQLFDPLGFGPADGEIIDDAGRDYVRLIVAVLGAVLVGWGTTILLIARGPLRDGADWAWTSIAVPLAMWFVVDTGASLALGWPTHALFNVAFAAALAPPLLMLRP